MAEQRGMRMSFLCKKSLYHVKESYRSTSFKVDLKVEDTNFNSSILSSAKHVFGINSGVVRGVVI